MVLLEEMRELNLKPTMECYWEALRGCAKAGDGDTAMKVLKLIKDEGGHPSFQHYSFALEALGKAGEGDRALAVVKEVLERKLIITKMGVGGVMLANIRAGKSEAAIDFFNNMEGRMKDKSRFGTLLNIAMQARIQTADLRAADEVLASFSRYDLKPNEQTFSIYLRVCAAAGNVDRVFEVFETVERRFGIKPNYQHYAAAIDELHFRGHTEPALKLLTIGGKIVVPLNLWCEHSGIATVCLHEEQPGFAAVCLRQILLRYKETQKLDRPLGVSLKTRKNSAMLDLPSTLPGRPSTYSVLVEELQRHKLRFVELPSNSESFETFAVVYF